MENIHELILKIMSTNKAKLVGVNGYIAIASNDEAANIFTYFALHLFHTRFNNMWNRMITNYHLVTLFVIIYEHLPDDQSHVSMLIHVK